MAKLNSAVQEALDAYRLKYKVLECDAELADTAAFCEHYGYKLSQSANTIIVIGKTEPAKFAACVVLGETKLDVNKKVCQLLGVRKASFAPMEDALKLSGMEYGGIVAIGLKDVQIFIDTYVKEQSEVIMGGGNRTSKLLLVPSELGKLPNAQFIDGLAKPTE